jgi:TfoX/Sxy family transcriptional regulator of competence genes
VPFDEGLAVRLEEMVAREFSHINGIEETRMFGGVVYLINGNMCMGIHKDTLIIRVGGDKAEELVQEDNVRPADFTGRVMKGWVTVEPDAMEDDENLKRFCESAVKFAKELPPKK